MNRFPNSRVLPSEEPVFSLNMILINLQDTGLTIWKTETFKLSRFFVSLSMDNSLSQIQLVTCCRVKSDVSTRRAHGKKFLLPFRLSKLCWQMSSEFNRWIRSVVVKVVAFLKPVYVKYTKIGSSFWLFKARLWDFEVLVQKFGQLFRSNLRAYYYRIKRSLPKCAACHLYNFRWLE